MKRQFLLAYDRDCLFSYIMTFVNTIKFSVSYLYNSHVLDKTKSGKYLKYDSTLYYL